MSIFLPLLCALWVSSVRSFSDGECHRKDPPPGVVVLSPGSRLDVTCSGHVEVNGVKVKRGSNLDERRTLVGNPSTPKVFSNNAFTTESDKTSINNAVDEEYHATTAETGVRSVSGENKRFSYSHKEYTTSPNMVQSTTASRIPQRESDWEEQETDSEGDYDNEEGEEGIRVTRDIKSRLQWMWIKKMEETGDQDWGEITITRGGTALSLASVSLKDSGNYTCLHNGKEIFTVEVIVAGPPETPILSCYKTSPSSKIRCEWTTQKPIIKKPNCYLWLSTGNQNFHQIRCSYSTRSSRCWCVIDHDDNNRRTVHTAFLCVTSIVGNATSPLIHFTPLDILKPGPPSNVSVRLEQGQRMRVTWNLPTSWKQRDNFYRIIFDLKYRPTISSNEQVIRIKDLRSYTITDALPGYDYLIQLRNREEYDGQWSEWSSPVTAKIWTESDDLTTTEPDIPEELGSGFLAGDYSDPTTGPVSLNSSYEPSHVLWIVVVCAVLSVFLAVFIFRHKNQLMSKLHSRSVIGPHRDLSSPHALGPPKGEVLMVFVPQLHKDYQSNDTHEGEENEEGHSATDRMEAMHFNNRSYFFLDRDL